MKTKSSIFDTLLRGSLLALPLLAGSAMAQTLPAAVSPEPTGYITRAADMELTDNNNGVIDQLELLQQLTGNSHDLMLAEAYYRKGDPRCIGLLEDFVSQNPASPYANDALLLIGDFLFFDHDFSKALNAYDRAEINGLGSAERAKYIYRKSLCLVKQGFTDEAAEGFAKLTSNRQYGAAARFYTAYIDYVQGRYAEAYRGFKDVADATASQFPAQNARYYLAQLDFRNGKYQETISHVKSLLSSDPEKEMIPELYRLAGESLFKTGNTREAKKYLQEYIDMTGDSAKMTALYALGAINYERGDYDKAYDLMQRVATDRNELAQSAFLYIGQCLENRGDYSGAAIAFDNAYRQNFNNDVAATALYNYIACTTRGGNVPFSSTIPLLNEFIDKFGNSHYAPTVEKYLAAAYFNEKDYAKALESIDRINNPGEDVLATKQKILYELGQQMISNDRPAEAQKYLTEARNLSKYDKKLAAQADLWLGDALYAQNKYAEAEKAYSAYLKAAPRDTNRPGALYNLAYTQFMQDNFKDAIKSFDAALNAGLNDVLAADARIRKADCFYYSGNLNDASNLYEQAMKQGASDADYAALRNAIITGVNGNNAAKAQQLEKLIKDYPRSRWIATALLEQAIAYSEMGDTDNALKSFSRLADDYPSAPQTRNALLQMAETYAQAGRSAEAAETYKRVIRTWPTSEQAKLASDDLRQIYALSGELDDYARWLQSIPGAPKLNNAEIERLSFEAAETAYNSPGGTDAMLQKYISQYPDGAYLAQALRDIAAYNWHEENDAAGALSALNRLITERPDASQVPGALMLKAEILEKTQPESPEILETWRQLEKTGGTDFSVEAWTGIMRNTKSEKERLEYARRISKSGGLTADGLDEAAYFEATALEKLGKRDEAMTIYARLAKNPMTEYGAHAAVALGQAYLDSKQPAKAIEQMLSLTSSGTPHRYWLARGYIVLADAYIAQGDKKLAKDYLTSLRANYPGKEKEIFNMIDSRLKKLNK